QVSQSTSAPTRHLAFWQNDGFDFSIGQSQQPIWRQMPGPQRMGRK
ncbi:MAG: hypothetical protein ACJA1F_002548, partial [Paracoccaceae bacterium]